MNFLNSFTINKKKIQNYHKPFVIAEIGSNHDQDIDKAKYLINKSAECGADAVKIQIFKSHDFGKLNKKITKIFDENAFNLNWLSKLNNFAKKQNVIFFASLFNPRYVSNLERINTPVYKLASSEIDNFTLLKKLSNINKPLLISTGMTDLENINKTITFLDKLKVKKIALLQCSSLYPQNINDLNLNVIETLKNKFPNIPIGFSDHSESIYPPAFAVSRGACIIEKHITIDKNDKGPDHSYALTIEQFSEMIRLINEAYKAGGKFTKDLHEIEKKTARRRGLYYNKDIKKGKIINIKDVSVKNPPNELQLKDIDLILDRKINKNVKKNAPIKESDF